MKFRFFLANNFQFPFRFQKRRARAVLICFSALIFSPTAAANVSAAPAPQKLTEDARQLIKQARKLSRRGELVEAEKNCRRALELNEQNSDAKLSLAQVLIKQRRFVEAYNLSFETARNEPKNADAFAVLGSVLLASGNFADARTTLVNALLLDRQNALAWAGLGMLNFYENRISLGLGQLQTAVSIEPFEPDYMFTLGQIAARAEDYRQAAEAYTRFLQISPQTDAERRARIKGLVGFLKFLGDKSALYSLGGAAETDVSFRLVNDRPVISLKINNRDEPLNFVLDTGSGISVISDETARLLKMKPISRGGLARGVGGDGKFEIVYGFLRSAEIGDVKIRNIPVYIREFHSKNEPIDGYIGLSLISKFLTTIDYGNLTFALKKKKSAGASDSRNVRSGDGGGDAKAETVSLPLRLTSSGFLSGEVNLEGIKTPLNFIVDTGASISVISNEIAGSEEINRFASKEKMRVIGAAGVTDEMFSYTLPKISFGANSREKIKAVALDLRVINETSGFEQAGILGGNFLKNYRLTFDFDRSKVIFEPVK